MAHRNLWQQSLSVQHCSWKTMIIYNCHVPDELTQKYVELAHNQFGRMSVHSMIEHKMQYNGTSLAMLPSLVELPRSPRSQSLAMLLWVAIPRLKHRMQQDFLCRFCDSAPFPIVPHTCCAWQNSPQRYTNAIKGWLDGVFESLKGTKT